MSRVTHKCRWGGEGGDRTFADGNAVSKCIREGQARCTKLTPRPLRVNTIAAIAAGGIVACIILVPARLVTRRKRKALGLWARGSLLVVDGERCLDWGALA